MRSHLMLAPKSVSSHSARGSGGELTVPRLLTLGKPRRLDLNEYLLNIQLESKLHPGGLRRAALASECGQQVCGALDSSVKFT